MDARLHEAEDEVALLRGEVRQLRTEVFIEKKQKEDCSYAYQRKKKSWRILYRVLPVGLKFPAPFGSIFKNFSKDQRTIFEASGPYFAIVMSGCPLLIVCHPDGCAFPYFICPVQVSS
ncbi:hypothetical protein CK203_072732 [Vitis vinifera]|uniref:Uncharacterized protein n=1 Tax=Vitis vinifera TaxID=29760 RepID=A0A438EZE0_VITVI|nr:hypothetical protein CK203_072732 [Vitis vinifera]